MLTFKNQKKSAAIIPLTIMIGAAIGSALILLFAQKGSRLRQRIKNKANDLISMPDSSEKNTSNDTGTMHAVMAGGATEPTISKAAAMVNHLKNTHQQIENHGEPS